jgi:hypothetical protein
MGVAAGVGGAAAPIYNCRIRLFEIINYYTNFIQYQIVLHVINLIAIASDVIFLYDEIEEGIFITI